MFVVLLTNRVHEARARRPAKVIADVRADLADAAALAVTDYADGPMAMPAKFRADRAVDWNPPVRHARKASVKKRSTASHAKTTKKTVAKKAASSKSSKAKASTSRSSASKAKATSSASRSKATARKSSTKR
jgi:ribonuclease E